MTELATTSYEQQLAELIDWNHPDLADTDSTVRSASSREQLLNVTRRIRLHPLNYFGFEPTYIDQLRASADPSRLEKAKAYFDRALQSDLLFPPHANAFVAVGRDNLLLILDEQRCKQICEAVLARQSDWGNNIWSFGITRGIADLIRFMASLPCCADEDLLPLFGWLTQIAPEEWRSARLWSERSLGSSGHNWWLASYLGLWTAGALFSHFTNLRQYASLLPTYLEREISLLFEADGWSKEGSFMYHRVSVIHLMEFTRLAERHGVRFSRSFYDQLQTIANATCTMLGPDGYGPTFGDDTHPWPEGSTRADQMKRHLEMNDVVNSYRAIAARFSVPAAKYICEQLYTEPLPYLTEAGDNLSGAYADLPATAPPLDTALTRSGLYAMRNGWTSDSDWLAVNAMSIGETVSSHKHADIFNLEMCVRGRRVLVDNWYGDISEDDGSYKSRADLINDPMKRRWRVGSSAHNVATVDERDIVDVKQVYRYEQTEHPFVDEFISKPEYCFFSGVHEAYRRLEHPVDAHRRKLFYLRDKYWILIDRFTTKDEEPHQFTQHFHLPPQAQQGENGFTTTGEGGNVLVAPMLEEGTVLNLEPNPHPIRGYQNPDHATITRNRGGDTIMVCVLVPFIGSQMPDVQLRHVPVRNEDQLLNPWQATSLEISIDGKSDYFFCQHMHWCLAWQAEQYAGTTRLFHSSC